MTVYQPVCTTLYILVDHHNVVGWRLVLNYMQTPPTHYYLESSGKWPHGSKTHTPPSRCVLWWRERKECWTSWWRCWVGRNLPLHGEGQRWHHECNPTCILVNWRWLRAHASYEMREVKDHLASSVWMHIHICPWCGSIIGETPCSSCEMRDIKDHPASPVWMHIHICSWCGSMIGENRRLVTDVPVEFEKWLVEVGDFRRITNHFRGTYRRIYPNLIKKTGGCQYVTGRTCKHENLSRWCPKFSQMWMLHTSWHWAKKGDVSVQAPKDEFHGDHILGGVKDVVGNTWWIRGDSQIIWWLTNPWPMDGDALCCRGSCQRPIIFTRVL